MKFEVPLMMPAIHSIRFSARPSRSALMMGMPPPTEASKATITPLFWAAAKISLPWVASSALLAVTTCLPCAIASSTSCFPTVYPPISSTTISTSLERATSNASGVTSARPPTIFFACSSALSATTEMRMARPARRWISSALRGSTSPVPRPTVPMPSSPTLMGFISPQPAFEMTFHAGPLRGKHAVHHGVAHAAVAPRPVMADDAVLLRAERLDRALRREVEIVGAQPHHPAFQRFESMGKKQKLARGVDMASLNALRVPGVAYLDAVGRGDDVVIAGASHDPARRLPDHPGEHVAVVLSLERSLDVFRGLAGRRHRGEPQLPEPAVGGGLGQTLLMLSRQRLEAHSVPFEHDGFRRDHAAPLRRPSFLNMSRMPRPAWRSRCSFSISAMRTWSSP